MHSWQVKICKTCSHWSEATKGQCTLNSQACGQFWRCQSWQALPAGGRGMHPQR